MAYQLLTQLPEGGRYVQIPEALLYALIGFLVVFAGIAFLIFVVWAVGKILSAKNTTATVKTTEVQTTPSVSVAPSNDVDEETVAVITAALMAYYQKTNPGCGFTVKRIKRI
ncbi:MAG: OadG family protein [Clostridia bacterium]|nr:OadG family protein [Clostridia bacterium]